jgi:hypothetical protein
METWKKYPENVPERSGMYWIAGDDFDGCPAIAIAQWTKFLTPSPPPRKQGMWSVPGLHICPVDHKTIRWFCEIADPPQVPEG